MHADERGLTMERVCIACGGSGLAEHVDRTLPPPPCRLCHPEEAELHMALARETRTVATARRLDAYQTLRAAIVLSDVVGNVVPPPATLSV
jgi:ribosomal protein S27AE